MKLTILTSFALLAFAANSLLARLALGQGDMGAHEFTVVRLSFGVIALATILGLKKRQGIVEQFHEGSWSGAAMLLTYAACFSYAYLALDTGTGALVLFAAVQFTIITVALVRRSISSFEIFGTIIAFAGFTYLVAPSIQSPSLVGFVAMSIAGVGWGAYTILGQKVEHPLQRTSGNFIRAAILGSALIVVILPNPTWTYRGLIAAIASGAITSGVGYVVWYAVLPKLTPAMSASLQLLVPAIAALLGWFVLNEQLTQRLGISGAIILTGLGVVVIAKQSQKPTNHAV